MRSRITTVTTTIAVSAALTAPAALADPSWRPGSVPDADTYVVLESDPGDWVGQGARHEYTPATARITVDRNLDPGEEGFRVSVDGDEWWWGRFAAPEGEAIDERLYDGAVRWRSNPPGVPALDWSGEGRGCNVVEGWFSVDGFAYDADGAVSFLLLRFEQHCEGGGPALRGEIRFDADAPAPAPLNPRPDPGDRWTPDRSLLPADAQPVVLLDSQPGDYVGQGEDHLYSGHDVVDVDHSLTAGVAVSVDADTDGDGTVDDRWDGDFVAHDTAERLELGLYDDLQRFPFHNPALGGLSWTGNGRGCNTVEGWFVVDEVGYTPNGLVTLSLRFAQSCDGDPPLYGLVEFGVDRTPVDTTPPVVTLTGPADRTKATDARFTFSASEPATFTCSLDGAPPTACTSPTTVTDLGGGGHSFTVVATDAAGNVSAPATWEWSIKGAGNGGGGGGKGGGKPPKR